MCKVLLRLLWGLSFTKTRVEWCQGGPWLLRECAGTTFWDILGGLGVPRVFFLGGNRQNYITFGGSGLFDWLPIIQKLIKSNFFSSGDSPSSEELIEMLTMQFGQEL